MALFFVISRKKGRGYVCLWEFDREHLKNDANNIGVEGAGVNLGQV